MPISFSEGNSQVAAAIASGTYISGLSIVQYSISYSWQESNVKDIFVGVQLYTGHNSNNGDWLGQPVTIRHHLPGSSGSLTDSGSFVFPSGADGECCFHVFVSIVYGNINENLLSESENIYGYPYSAPTLPALPILRCNADGTTNESGTRAKITATYAVSPIGDNNTKALVVKYREAGATTWTQETIDISELDYSDSVPETVLAATFAADKTYEVRAELTDLLNTTTNDKTLAPAFALVHYHADKAHVAFGKYAESGGPGFDVALDARFRDEVQFDGAVQFDDDVQFGQAPTYASPSSALEALGIYCGRSTWTRASSSTDRKTISFGKTLPSIPRAVIFVMGTDGGSTSFTWGNTPETITATGFEIGYNTGTTSTRTLEIDWVAIL